jgi:hypothetical protein
MKIINITLSLALAMVTFTPGFAGHPNKSAPKHAPSCRTTRTQSTCQTTKTESSCNRTAKVKSDTVRTCAQTQVNTTSVNNNQDSEATGFTVKTTSEPLEKDSQDKTCHQGGAAGATSHASTNSKSTAEHSGPHNK